MSNNPYAPLIHFIEKKPALLLIIPLVVVVSIFIFIMSNKQKGLKNVKNITIGNNQMGSAKFMSEEEKLKTFKKIEFNPKLWRENEESRKKLKQGMVWGLTGYNPKNKKGDYKIIGKKRMTLLDTSDSNTLLIGPPGIGKTSCFLMPQIEYACATGQRLIITDTKGDIIEDIGKVMEEKYGYNIILIDFRNPLRGDSFNFLQLVNKYMDMAKSSDNDIDKVKFEALAEKNAKVVADTIVNSNGGKNTGANSFFFDTAKGILTSTILLVSKYGEKGTRHIVSVFKLIQEMSEFETKEDDENLTESKFAKLINKLDENDKTKWFAGASTTADIKTASGCFSTSLTILTKFIDTEIEQILCFDSKFNMEDFVDKKSAIFVTLPEEDTTKYFLFSLLLNQIYGQLLYIADSKYNRRFPNTVRLFLDEFGTLPPIEGVEVMFTASRSRNILSVPIIQMFSQLKKYGDGEKMIRDSCKNTLFSGFAPTSEDSKELSERMGNFTTQTGSISRNNRKNNITKSMSSRPLMYPNEIANLEFGKFILLRTGSNPLKLNIPLFFNWGIKKSEIKFSVKTEVKETKFLDIQYLIKNIETSRKEEKIIIKEKLKLNRTKLEIEKEEKEIESLKKKLLGEEEKKELNNDEKILKNIESENELLENKKRALIEEKRRLLAELNNKKFKELNNIKDENLEEINDNELNLEDEVLKEINDNELNSEDEVLEEINNDELNSEDEILEEINDNELNSEDEILEEINDNELNSEDEILEEINDNELNSEDEILEEINDNELNSEDEILEEINDNELNSEDEILEEKFKNFEKTKFYMEEEKMYIDENKVLNDIKEEIEEKELIEFEDDEINKLNLKGKKNNLKFNSKILNIE